MQLYESKLYEMLLSLLMGRNKLVYYLSTYLTTWLVATRGLDPPMALGRIEPVS